ncbi:hypothetical protein EV121DRAFT_284537 [Schizophyllum commune]
MDHRPSLENTSVERIREAGPRRVGEKEQERLRRAWREGEDRIQRLKVSRDGGNFEVEKVNSMLGTAPRVPHEMLSEICEWAMAGIEDGVKSGRQLGSMRAVSTTWRDVVDRTPRLWTRACTRGDQFVHLRQYKARSGALLMTFEHDGENAGHIAMGGLTALGRATLRLTSLKLRGTWAFFGGHVPTPLFQALSTADLTLEGIPHRGALKLLTFAPGLKNLSIGWSGTAMDEHFVLDVPDFPLLSSLHLRGQDRGGKNFVSHLLSLDLRGDLSYLLAQLTAPRMGALTLKEVRRSRRCVRDLAAMLTRPGGCPDLETLVLDRVRSGLPAAWSSLTACLRALRGLKTLHVIEAGSHGGRFGTEELFNAMAADARPVLMPRLENFRYRPPVDGLLVEDWAALEKVRKSRAASKTVDGQDVVELSVRLDEM